MRCVKESEGFIKFIHAGNNQLGNLFAVAGGSFDIEEDEEVFLKCNCRQLDYANFTFYFRCFARVK